MKPTKILLTGLTGLTAALSFGQNATSADERIRGRRVQVNGGSVLVYEMKIETVDGVKQNSHVPVPRMLDSFFYFKPQAGVQYSIGGVVYGLVYLPGNKAPTAANCDTLPDEAAKKDCAACKEHTSAWYSNIQHCDYGKYFWIRASDLSNVDNSYRYGLWQPKLAIGALTIPIVLRPSRGDLPFDGDGQLSINGSLGLRWRLHDTQSNYVSILGFAGLKSMKFTKQNNDGLAEDQEEISGSGLAVGTGLSLQWRQTQVGIFFGCDKAFGTLSKTYAYQDALWIGFGIGVEIFTPSGQGKVADAGNPASN